MEPVFLVLSDTPILGLQKSYAQYFTEILNDEKAIYKSEHKDDGVYFWIQPTIHLSMVLIRLISSHVHLQTKLK